MPPFVRLFLPFHCRQKRAKWKLFFVKAPLKTHMCEFVRHKVCNPHCRGPPPQCCLCVNWSIYGQLSILVHPSLPPFFCCLTLFCPPTLPPARIAGGFFFFPGVQCFSRRFDCQQPKMEGSEPMLYLPRSLITQTWFVIYTLIGTALTHLVCTGGSGLGGEGEVWSGLIKAWTSAPFYCQQGDTSGSSSSRSIWWRVLPAVFLWKPALFFGIRGTIKPLKSALE